MALAVKYKAYIVSGNFKQDLFPVCGSETDAQNFIDEFVPASVDGLRAGPRGSGRICVRTSRRRPGVRPQADAPAQEPSSRRRERRGTVEPDPRDRAADPGSAPPDGGDHAHAP